jgi:hypothetical protein
VFILDAVYKLIRDEMSIEILKFHMEDRRGCNRKGAKVAKEEALGLDHFSIAGFTAIEKASLAKNVTRFWPKYNLPLLYVHSGLSESASSLPCTYLD